MSAVEADNRVVSLLKGRRENELEGMLTNMQVRVQHPVFTIYYYYTYDSRTN